LSFDFETKSLVAKTWSHYWRLTESLMYMPVLLVSLSLVSQAVVEAAGSSFCFYQLRKSYEALRSRCYNRQAHEKSAPFWGPFRPSSPDPSAKTVKHQEQEHKRWPNLGGVTCTGLLINRLVHQRAISPRTADKQDGKTNEHVLAGCERGRVRSRLLRGMDRYCSLWAWALRAARVSRAVCCRTLAIADARFSNAHLRYAFSAARSSKQMGVHIHEGLKKIDEESTASP